MSSDRILADPPERPEDEPERERPAPESTPPEATKEAEGGEDEAEKPAEPAPEDTAKRMRDFQDRIDALTREKWEARRDADARAQRLAELERPQQHPGDPQDPVEVAKQQLRAEQARRDFDSACNRTFQAGKTEFPDFDQAVSALNAVGAGNRPDFLAAVTQLPEGHRVYRQLASNLDDAARVLSLPPIQMAVELARLAVSPAAREAAPPPRSLAPPVSNAPEPIRPIGGGSRGVPNLERVSMAEFIKIRDKEESERRRM